MARFEVNRLCPVTGQPHARVLGYLSALGVGRSNPTYREDFLAVLGLASEDEFPIVEGPTGFVFAGWLPDGEFLRRVYEEAIDHSRTATETVWYRRSMLEFAAALLEFVEQDAPPLRLLDYGCGYGGLLRILGSRDIQAYGYEPSEARTVLATQPNVAVFADFNAVRQAGPFDIMVCTEVLEHVPEPRELLRFFKANVSPGAVLAITVPDCATDYVQSSLDQAAAAGTTSPVLNPWEHLNYFSSASLRQLLSEEGFSVLADFGRTRAAREACARFGDEPPSNVAINGLRVAKRAWVAPPSTELFCRCP